LFFFFYKKKKNKSDYVITKDLMLGWKGTPDDNKEKKKKTLLAETQLGLLDLYKTTSQHRDGNWV